MAKADIDRILAQMAQRPVPQGLAARRAYSDDNLNFFAPHPDAVVTETTLAGLPADIITTPRSDRRRKVLFLHGGAYVIGSRKSHRTLSSYLADTAQAEVTLIDYRLAPEHPFPAAVDDALAAYRAMLTQGVTPQQVAIAGDSAGGGLALGMTLAARDAGTPLPAAIATLSPWVDLAGQSPSLVVRAARDPRLTPQVLEDFAALYVKEANRRNPLASPIYGDLTGLPPLLIQVGEREILFDDSTRLFAAAEAAGLHVSFSAWPHMTHVWHHYAPALPEARAALGEAGDFIKRWIPL